MSQPAYDAVAKDAAALLPVVDGRTIARLLILKLSSLGDVVHALPVAAALRDRYPALHLTWAVEARCAPVVRAQGAVDRIVELPRLEWTSPDRVWSAAVRRALVEVRATRYDAVLDLQGLLKTSLLALASRAPLRIGVTPQREGSRLVSRPVPIAAGRWHVVETLLATSQFLGAPTAAVRFGLHVEPSVSGAVAMRLAAAGVDAARPLLVVNPSASRPAKSWPASRWAAVIDALAEDGDVVVIGGAEQRAAHAAVCAAAGGGTVDITGTTSLVELIALLSRCALHLAPDTGTLHLAAALGRPVVGVYGPTPTWRLAPWGQPEGALSGAAQCGVTCPRVCLRGRRCLDAVTVAEVVGRARQLLARGA